MITGNEPAMPVSYIKTDEGTVFNSCDDNLGGLTIRQLALKDFMCAIIQSDEYSVAWQDEDMIEDINGKFIKMGDGYVYGGALLESTDKRYSCVTTASQRIANEASRLTNAYIEQLNK